MHVWTRLTKSARARPASACTPTAWWSTTTWSAAVLKKLDELGIADNTIVVYGTDNGAETGTWPDGGTTPFHGEKGTTWEGGFRVPMLVRWPGVIKPGTIINDIFSQEDWLPTLLAAAGEPDIVEQGARQATAPAARPSRSTSTATTSCPSSRARRRRGRARRSSTSAPAAN